MTCVFPATSGHLSITCIRWALPIVRIRSAPRTRRWVRGFDRKPVRESPMRPAATPALCEAWPPSDAAVPADETLTFRIPASRSRLLIMTSASGLLQVLPVQMNRIENRFFKIRPFPETPDPGAAPRICELLPPRWWTAAYPRSVRHLAEDRSCRQST